jgi:hypothetical protein
MFKCSFHVCLWRPSSEPVSVGIPDEDIGCLRCRLTCVSIRGSVSYLEQAFAIVRPEGTALTNAHRNLTRHLAAGLLLTLLGVSAPALARSQPAPPSRSSPTPGVAVHVTLGQAVYPLYGPWKFTVGDSPLDPATQKPLWAEPGFDDSRWETADLTPQEGSIDPVSGLSGYVPGWTAKGHPGYWGYAWYRLRISVDGTTQGGLALSGPNIVDDAFQAFFNGTLVGSFGNFSRPHPVLYSTQPTFFELPPGAIGNGRTEVVAFRLWMAPSTLLDQPDAGGFHTAPLIGQKDMVSAGYQVRWLELIRTYATDPIFAALYLLLALLAFSLSIYDRSDKVYYWIATVYLISAAEEILVAFSGMSQTISSPVWYGFEGALLVPLVNGLWIMVWWVWFRLKRPAWLPRAIVVQTLLYMVGNLLGGEFIFGLVSHPVATAFHLLSLLARLTFAILLIVVVVLGGRLQGREGWVALPAVALLGVSKFASELGLLHIRLSWFPFGVGVGLGTAASLLLIVALFFLLLRRMLISLQLQREQALDIKQAAGVQQLILPQAHAVYAGVTVESEYRPSRQVGGDFFQVIPNQFDQSLLLVAGDVAGKGLQAGMLVALIVGAIRTAVEGSTDPLFVLETLNRQLVGRHSALATCLALSIAADGSVTLANAGHIPPYLNGAPVAMEGALPLGMIDGADFSVMRFPLIAGDTLVVMSDGVPEATNEKGELFGFDRIAQLLAGKLTISALAEAAQQHGQNDDISLVALTRTATA